MSAICRLCGGQPDAEVVARWDLRIDRDAPSQNQRLVNAGPGRWAYSTERKVWVALLAASGHAGRVPPARAPRRVTFTRLFSGRKKLRDHANVIGGMKPVVDAMVLVGLLVDDSPKFFEGFYRQVRIEHGGGTLIAIEELA